MNLEQKLTDLYATKPNAIPLDAQLRLAQLYEQGKSLAEIARALGLDKMDTVSRRLAWLKKNGIITQRPLRRARGTSGNDKLTRQQVVQAVKRRLAGEQYKEIARDLGVSSSNIQAICNGKSWADVVKPYAAQLAALRGSQMTLRDQVKADGLARRQPPPPPAPIGEYRELGEVQVFDGQVLGDYGTVVPDNAAYLTLKMESSNLNLSTSLTEQAGWQAGDRIRFLQDNGRWYVASAGVTTGFLLSYLSTRTLTTNVGPVADMLRDALGLLITQSYRIRVELEAAGYQGLPAHLLTTDVQQTTQRPSRGSINPRKVTNPTTPQPQHEGD